MQVTLCTAGRDADLGAMALTKAAVMAHLSRMIEARSAAIGAFIAETRASFTSDTKSSAGDKHEVGRAMIQQELDKQEAQRGQLLSLQHELQRVSVERIFTSAAFGSLVTTDQGIYFIAIGLGAVQMDGLTCYAISLASPIGQLLNGRKAGDKVVFNGRQITIRSVD